MVNVYIDTSVIVGCFDLEFKEWSVALFEDFKIGTRKLVFSDLVIKELLRAPENVEAKLLEVPAEFQIRLDSTEEAHALAATYIREGALSEKYKDDALHIALATIHHADVLASWNFKHIVNPDRIILYNSINIRLGYRSIEIRSPRAILNALLNEKG
jgi:predicted nucleic acid-binding protein